MLKSVSSLAAVLTMALGILLLATSCGETVATPSALSQECDILSFDITNCVSSIDQVTAAITVSAPYGTNPDGLTPVISLSEGATVSPVSGTAIPFTDGVSYPFTVTAEDGKTTRTYNATVNVTPASVDTSFTSTLGVVRLADSKLSSIPAATTLAELEAAITPTVSTATFDIFDADGTTPATILDSTKVLIVTAEDTTVTKTYALSVAAADYINFVLKDVSNNYSDGGIAAIVTAADGISGWPYSVDLGTPADITGVITSKSSYSFTIQDATAAIQVMGTTAEGIGTEVTVTGVTNVASNYSQYRINEGNYSAIEQVSLNNNLYYVDASGVTMDKSNMNHLFKFTGFATGDVSSNSNTALALSETGLFYQDSTGDQATTDDIVLYVGDFYGPSEISYNEYRIVLNKSDYFVVSSTLIGAADIAGTLTSVTAPITGDTQLAIPSVPSGYSIAIFSSSNESVIALDGTITQTSQDEIVNLVFVITKDSDGTTANTASISVTVPLGRFATGGTATDLFISEYVEGSSNNKAVEIANNTGSDIDMSLYQIVLFSYGSSGPYTIADTSDPANGGNSWIGSGTLSNGSVFVIGNSSLDSSVTTDIDSTITYFNGNDTLCLYKNTGTVETPVWSLIDVFGTNDGSYYASNMTLLRKPGAGPSTTFNQADDWIEMGINSFDDLGSHIY